jgi:hypothetical protein
MTPPGNEPATFRLVLPFLNQLCHRVQQTSKKGNRRTSLTNLIGRYHKIRQNMEPSRDLKCILFTEIFLICKCLIFNCEVREAFISTKKVIYCILIITIVIFDLNIVQFVITKRNMVKAEKIIINLQKTTCRQAVVD